VNKIDFTPVPQDHTVSTLCMFVHQVSRKKANNFYLHTAQTNFGTIELELKL